MRLFPGTNWPRPWNKQLFFKGRSLQCGFWPQSSQILICILLWIFGWIYPPVFFQGKRPKKKKIHRKIARKIHQGISSENSPRISAEALSWLFSAKLHQIFSMLSRWRMGFASGTDAPQRASPRHVCACFLFIQFCCVVAACYRVLVSGTAQIKKIRAPIKIKSALPPPPPKPKIPPLKCGILWTGLFLQNGRIFPGVHKIGAAISGPRIADTNFMDTRIFLTKHNHNHNFPKTFCIWCRTKTAFDDTSDEKSLWFLCVPLCRRGIWCVIRGYPKNEKLCPARWTQKWSWSWLVRPLLYRQKPKFLPLT